MFPVKPVSHAFIQQPYCPLSRFYASSSSSSSSNPLGGMDPKMALAAQKIFAAIQRDATLTQLCTTLSTKLADKKVIDPMDPTKPPSMTDLMKIAMDGEITGLIKQVMGRLKALGVLDDDAVRQGMGAAGNNGGGGLFGALLGGGNVAGPVPPPPPGVEDAEFRDVVEEGKSGKKVGVADKVKSLFRK
ncbi:UNVERIFIED_CONTAM: hypothetical protein HDU68_008896 [Siphonaria sp. JEL0065]|nr:hypothetical protein HDU68_008896 [Siphonaria sp. JEL0065]